MGVLLYNFFHYYGYVFNYSESAIRVRDKQPTVILKDELAKEMNEYRHTSIFFIEDPVQNCRFYFSNTLINLIICFEFFFINFDLTNF